MMSCSALALLTQQMAHVCLAQPLLSRTVCKALSGSNNLQQWRFKSGGKGKRTKDETVNLQHQEWVKFQQSIAVDGFETGQTTKATETALRGRKDRGGKQLRKRKEKEMAETLKKERLTESLGGGLFPPLRYSQEETERLLAEAYAAIPKRAGKRGTKNLKRQYLRWFKVRKLHAKLKRERIAAHYRRMQNRSRIFKEVKAVKETAAQTRARDAAYQEAVFRKWTQTMLFRGNSNKKETETIEG